MGPEIDGLAVHGQFHRRGPANHDFLASLTGLALVSAVRVRVHETDEARLDLSRLLKPAAILAMVGIGLFETANNMHFAYADRIGLAYELDYETVGAGFDEVDALFGK